MSCIFRNLSLVILALVGGTDGRPVAAQPPQAIAIGDFKNVNNEQRFSLSADGTWLAYVTADVIDVTDKRRSGAVTSRLGLRNLVTGEKIDFPDSLPDGHASLPAWSPDGRTLAYVAQGNKKQMELRLWDSRTRATRSFNGREPATDAALRPLLRWSPDGTTIFFLAMRSDTYVGTLEGADEVDNRKIYMNGLGRLLYEDKEHAGITVLDYDPARDGSGAQAATQSAASDPGTQKAMASKTDIVGLDVSTGVTRRVFTGPALMGFSLSPDGKQIFALSLKRLEVTPGNQYFADYFVVPVMPAGVAETTIATNLAPREARDWRGVKVEPMVADAHQDYWPREAWSPDSRFVAWTEHGARTEGDLMLLDVETRAVRNVTQALKLPLDARDALPGAENRRWGLYRGKFGDDQFTPVWSSDGRSLYLRRASSVSKAVDRSGMKGELWAVDVATGAARQLAPGARFGLDRVIAHDGVVWSGRMGHGLIVSARFADGSGFVRIDPVSGKYTPIAQFKGNATRAALDDWSVVFSPASTADKLIFRNERSDSPPELYELDVKDNAVRQVTDINRSSASLALPSVRLLQWTAATGENVGGLLYLPRDAARKPGHAKPPVILDIYPGWDLSLGDQTYVGRTLAGNLLYAELLDAGMAVFVPDTPYKGAGNACKEITVNTVAALEAVGASGLVDATRSGVTGLSFGGYSTNCVVTHSGRFKAAASRAGLSNYFDQDLALRTVGGQAKLANGESPESPEMIRRYISDSPVFHAEKVTTPLLLVHGKFDQTAAFPHSLAMYRAINRAGKTPVRLVGYDNAGHGVDMLPDARRRVVDWFKQYLMPLQSNVP